MPERERESLSCEEHFSETHHDPVIAFLHRLIRQAVRALAVLIAIEIFVNITLYLRDDVIHVKLVVATALMAISRKVIVLDYATIDPAYVYATGLTVLALGVTYWLVATRART